MSERTGLGVVEVGVLRAAAAAVALPRRRRVRTTRLLAVAERDHGIHPRYGYEAVCRLMRWPDRVPLIDGRGNFRTVWGITVDLPCQFPAKLADVIRAAVDTDRPADQLATLARVRTLLDT